MAEEVVMYSTFHLKEELTLAGLSLAQIDILRSRGGPYSNNNYGIFKFSRTGELRIPIQTTGNNKVFILMTNTDDDAPTFRLLIEDPTGGKIADETVGGKIPPRNA